MPKIKYILAQRIKPLYLLLGTFISLLLIYFFVDFDEFYPSKPHDIGLSELTQPESRGKDQLKEEQKKEPYIYAGRWGEGFRITWPAKIIRSSSGDIYVLDRNRNKIWKFIMSGNDVIDFMNIRHKELDLPNYFALDNNSNLYVNSGRYGKLLKFNSEGTFIKMWNSYESKEAYRGIKYISVSGIAVDGKGDVYAINKRESSICKFDSEGNFIKEWRITESSSGPLCKGIAIDSSDNIYVCSNNSVQKFDSEGNFILEFGEHGSNNGQFKNPSDIAIGPDGNVYVADSGNHRIQIFSSSGEWLGKWGKKGVKDGEIKGPISITVDKDGNAYVISSADVNYKIQVFIPSKEKPDK